ncbi:MAG: type II toxin-antitoxin system HigB family toxin [Saprospiraceae bacterium]|nr:type II toxin-antitoxin system HigB family toxin [Saprospiraceae bacterium]
MRKKWTHIGNIVYLSDVYEGNRIKYIEKFWNKNKDAKEQLLAWNREVGLADWSNSNELKAKFGTASIITSRRVVFNVNGNRYRLIVDIEYRLGIIFIVWVGTHKQYDKIDAKEIEYVKTNKE